MKFACAACDLVINFTKFLRNDENSVIFSWNHWCMHHATILTKICNEIWSLLGNTHDLTKILNFYTCFLRFRIRYSRQKWKRWNMEHSKIIIYELKNTNYITAEESLNGGTCRPLLLSKNTKQVFGRDQKGRHHQAKKKLLIFHRNGSFTLLFMPMNFFLGRRRWKTMVWK